MTCLFIGGPADGRQVETRGEPYWRVAKRNEIPAVLRDGPEIEVVPTFFEYDEYHLVNTTSGVSFYKLASMSDAQVMARLLNHYHPEVIEPGIKFQATGRLWEIEKPVYNSLDYYCRDHENSLGVFAADTVINNRIWSE